MEPKVYRAKISDFKTLGEKNPNKGTERGVYMVERSLEKLGAWRSITATADDVIPAGNHTIEAYATQGNEDVLVIETDGKQLVVVKRTDITSDDPRAKEYAIADNRASQVGLDWSAEEIQALVDADLNLSDWFQADELADLLAGLDLGGSAGDDPGADVDRAGELQVKWNTARGQVWEVPSLATLGRCHRVMCGDSTSAEDVARLMGGEKAALIFTDPPYNVTDNEWDKFDTQAFTTFLEKTVNIFKSVLAPNSCLYVCLNWRFVAELKLMLDRHFRILNWIIWHHVSRGAQFKFYTPSHQDILFYTNGDKYHFDASSELEEYAQSSIDRDKYNPRQYVLERDGKHPSDVWHYPQVRGNAHENEPHPTQKPIDLVERAIKVSSKPGGIVTDLFLGSGTTLVACEQTGRIGYGMEIAPEYCAVILERLSGMGLAPRVVEG